MDAARRQQLADEATLLLDDLARAVEESWADLMPVAATWSPDSLQRARAAARAALEALLRQLVQGDLDERAFIRTRDLVFGHGHATADEAAELLRTVRIVGVEGLTVGLAERAGLTRDERWEIQRQATGLCGDLLGRPERLDPRIVDAALADLERSGPDVR